MILLLDNYDSFAHNLARYLRELHQQVTVVRNDRTSIDDIISLAPQAIVMSPGPCTPRESGICLPVVQQLANRFPMLGVCLGHQAICEAYGGAIVRVPPVHGQSSPVHHNQHPLFDGLPSPMTAGRYHSLVADTKTIDKPLEAIAWTSDKTLMAVAHQSLPIFGVQFHPESVLTDGGYQLLANFLELAGITVDAALVQQATSRLLEQIAAPVTSVSERLDTPGPHPWQ